MQIVRKHFELIDSTNNWAKQHGESLDPRALTVITASAQTGGRGRFNRTWHSPVGLNIYATYTFFLKGLRADLGNLPQVLALSAAEVLEKEIGGIELKWPNDIQIRGKKLGGILSETTWIEKQLLVVLGIGLNINMPQSLLDEIDRPATSLLGETGREGDVEVWLEQLTQKFHGNLEKFLGKGFAQFLKSYESRLCHRKGDRVKFYDNQKVWEGLYIGLTEDGALRLEAEGKERVFIAGEFVLEPRGT